MKKNEIDIKSVKDKILLALKILYEKDLFLITNYTHERAVTHKFAIYIELLFPEWDVDCEYNRIGEDNSKALLDQTTSYPDIIIHRRNSKDNLLVIEAKSIHSQNHDDKKDKRKIEEYIKNKRYDYRYGLWIRFYEKIEETELNWFENKNGDCIEVVA